MLRARVGELGGAAALNLSAGVTDVILLPGRADDSRMDRIAARRLALHDAARLSTPTDVPALDPADHHHCLTPPQFIEVQVLPRGGVIDLPGATEEGECWTVDSHLGSPDHVGDRHRGLHCR